MAERKGPFDVGALFATALAGIISDPEDGRPSKATEGTSHIDPALPKKLSRRRRATTFGESKRPLQELETPPVRSTDQNTRTTASGAGKEIAPEADSNQQPHFSSPEGFAQLFESFADNGNVDSSYVGHTGSVSRPTKAPDPRIVSRRSVDSDDDSARWSTRSAPASTRARLTLSLGRRLESAFRSSSVPAYNGKGPEADVGTGAARHSAFKSLKRIRPRARARERDDWRGPSNALQRVVLGKKRLMDTARLEQHLQSPYKTPKRRRKGLIVPHTNEDVVLGQTESSSPTILQFGHPTQLTVHKPKVTETGSPIPLMPNPVSMATTAALKATITGMSDALREQIATNIEGDNLNVEASSSDKVPYSIRPDTRMLPKQALMTPHVAKKPRKTKVPLRQASSKHRRLPLSADPDRTLVEAHHTQQNVETLSSPLSYPISSPSSSAVNNSTPSSARTKLLRSQKKGLGHRRRLLRTIHQLSNVIMPRVNLSLCAS